jgi:hypothetical protein
VDRRGIIGVLALTIAGAAALIGCDQPKFGSPVSREGLTTPIACTKIDDAGGGFHYVWVPDLSSAATRVPVDYLELHDPQLPAPVTFGEKCKGAKDATACAASFDRAQQTITSGWPTFEPVVANEKTTYLAWTRGDANGVVTSADDVQSFFTLTDVQGAAIFLWARGESISCGDASQMNAAVVADGVEIVTTTYDTCTNSADLHERTIENVELVRPDGTTSTVRSSTTFQEACGG